MIKIENLAFSYGQTPVLNNISMTLEDGKIYGLLGENGVGKTTLLSLLAGLKKAKTGSIGIDGENPYSRRPDILGDQYFLTDEPAPQNEEAQKWARMNGKFWPRYNHGQFLQIMAELENDPALGSAADSVCLRGNKALMVYLKQNIGLYKLRLDGRCAHDHERLAREHGCALGNGPDIALEPEIAQVFEKLLSYLGQEDILDVQLRFFDKVEQKIERSVEFIQMHPVFHAPSSSNKQGNQPIGCIQKPFCNILCQIADE